MTTSDNLALSICKYIILIMQYLYTYIISHLQIFYPVTTFESLMVSLYPKIYYEYRTSETWYIIGYIKLYNSVKS